MAPLFVLDVALVLAFAYFLATAFRPPTRPAFLTSLFVLVWVDLVLTAEILSLLHLLTAWGMAAGHLILGAAAFLVWQAAGRPRHPRFSFPSPPEWLASLKSCPDLWTLGLTVGLAYALLAVINLLVPPNNIDSMIYHLDKVAHWIQNRSLAPWPTSFLRRTLFPFNAEIGSLWSMLFLRRDLLTGFVQWSSALAAGTAVFGMARGFGAARPQAAFGSSVFLTLPMIVLQSTTTQNDLATAAMFAVMAYLFLLGLKTKHRGMLILSGAALGLVIGMKLTAVLITPGFVLAAAYVTLTRRPRPFRLLLVWAGACLAGFVLLGAFNYVQSWLYLHPGVQLEGHTGQIIEKRQNRDVKSQAGEKSDLFDRNQLPLSPFGLFDPALARINIARDIYSFMDLTGVPQPAAKSAARVRAAAGRAVFSVLDLIPTNQRFTLYGFRYDFTDPEPQASEAGSFFGPLGFFLCLPLVIYGLITGLAKRDARLFGPLAFLGFMLLSAASQSWHPYRGRYYCAAIALVAPLAAALYRRGTFRVLLRGLIVSIALVVMTVTILTDVQKPLIGPRAIWNKTRLERRLGLLNSSGFRVPIIDHEIPQDATVAAVLTVNDPEYLLFGERLSRKVVTVFPPPDVVNRDWLLQSPFDYFLVHCGKFRRVKGSLTPEFRRVTMSPYRIIIRQK